MQSTGAPLTTARTALTGPRRSSRRASFWMTAVTGLVLLALASAVFTMAALSRRVNRSAADLHTADEVLLAATVVRAELAFAVIIGNVDAELGTDSSVEIDISAAEAGLALATVRGGYELLIDGGSVTEDEFQRVAEPFLESSSAVIGYLDQGEVTQARERADGSLDATFDRLTTDLVALRSELADQVSNRNEVLGRISNMATFVIAFVVPTAAFFVHRELVRRPRETQEVATTLEVERAATRDEQKLVSAVAEDLVVASADLYDSVEAADPAERIRARSSELDTRVGELATLAELIEGSHRSRIAPQRLAPIVTAAIGAARDHDATVTVEVGETAVRADAEDLGQAIDALVDNAVRHGAETVHVAASTRGETTELVIGDNGPGLSSEVRDALFGDGDLRARRDALTGRIGLGLLVAQALIERMGGTISYERTGEVSTFTVVLAAASPSELERVERTVVAETASPVEPAPAPAATLVDS